MLLSELSARLYSAASAEEFSVFFDTPFMLVEVDGAFPLPPHRPPCPVIAITEDPIPPPLADVVVPNRQQAESIELAISNSPIASAVLVQLLRYNEGISIPQRLVAESLAYSTLQHGSEFQRWIGGREQRKPSPSTDEPAVTVERVEDELYLTLNRPEKRNAYNAEMRDALCAGLSLLSFDSGIRRATLRGAGSCFSAGGDLDEFGEATDAGLAHVSRVARSAGNLMASVHDRIEVHVHGACIGAGIELPAFAHRVLARRDAFFQLPEVSMGLVPGAGGTASILPRIGRHRMAAWALTAARIDAETAMSWGLVDELAD